MFQRLHFFFLSYTLTLMKQTIYYLAGAIIGKVLFSITFVSLLFVTTQ